MLPEFAKHLNDAIHPLNIAFASVERAQRVADKKELEALDPYVEVLDSLCVEFQRIALDSIRRANLKQYESTYQVDDVM